MTHGPAVSITHHEREYKRLPFSGLISDLFLPVVYFPFLGGMKDSKNHLLKLVKH